MSDLQRASWVISGGRSREPGQPLNVAPVLASNFYLPGSSTYSRSEGTETTLALESILGGLDGGEALVFSSGMAAAAVVLNRLPAGATVAVPLDPYHGVAGLVADGETQGRWRVVRLHLDDTQSWVDAALTTDLLWIESPANPLITVADLPAICAAPRSPGTIIAVDSTFATPLLQRPLELGADVVMHSATKFLGGHSDLLAGVVVTADMDLYGEFHQRRVLNGATIGAMEAFLTTRGLRTLALRMDKAQSNAQILAERLNGHSQITRVRYPGLPDDEFHAVASSFMDGYGAMMSFETTGSGERAAAVAENTQLIHHATSLGGVESTMERRAGIAGQESMPVTLIRFSVGCEDVEDIWSDLKQALASTSC